MGVDRRATKAAMGWLVARVTRTDRTHAELAAMTGVSRKTIDRLVSGRSVPTLATLLALASALGYSREDAERLHRGEIPDPSGVSVGLTGEQLAELLAAMKPEERRRPLVCAMTGGAVIAVKVAGVALLLEAAGV